MQFSTTTSSATFGAAFGTILNSKTAARVAAIVLLATLCGLCTHFALKLLYGAPGPNQASPHGGATTADTAQIATPNWLQGAAPSAAPMASDYKLLGVVAQGASGFALIQINSPVAASTANSANPKRPQILRIGQRLPDGARLISVDSKSATLDIQGSQRTLSLEANNKAGASILTNNFAAPNATPNANYGASASPSTAMNSAANDAAIQAHMQQLQQQQIQQQQQQAQQQQLEQASTQSSRESNSPPSSAQVNEASIPPSMRKRMGGLGSRTP